MIPWPGKNKTMCATLAISNVELGLRECIEPVHAIEWVPQVNSKQGTQLPPAVPNVKSGSRIKDWGFQSNGELWSYY